MKWHGVDEFFAMGGYALYVWGAYAVTAALMVVEPLLVARRRRRAWAQVRLAVDVERQALPGAAASLAQQGPRT